jgi:hypothetical protein
MKSFVDQAREFLEISGKFVALSFAIVYTTGLLIVAFHLGQYGVFPLSLLRTQYIVAGLLMFVPSVVTLAFVSAAFNDPYRTHGEDDEGQPAKTISVETAKRVGQYLWNAFLTVIVLNTILAALASLFIPSLENAEYLIFQHWKSFLWCSLQIVILTKVASVVFTHLLVVSIDPASYLKRSRLVAVGMALGFFLVMFLYSAQYFARRIYPLIPYEFGGGQPLKVVFLLKPDATTELAPVLAMDATGKESVPYYLLMETTESYFVISQKRDERAIELKKDMVHAVVVLAQDQNGTRD